MDWSKAKTILIVAFLLLNIFLLFMIFFTNPSEIFQSEYITHAKNYLASKDIKIKADIPKISGTAGKVLYSTKGYDTLSISGLVFEKDVPVSVEDGISSIEYGSEKIVLSANELYIVDRLPDGAGLFNNIKKFEKELYKYLNKLGYKKSDLTGGLIEISDNEKVFKYTVKFKKSQVFDLIISARLNNEGVMVLSTPTKEINKENGQNEILSAYQLLVTAGLPSGVEIEAVDFGYKQISKGDLYGNPVWRVILNNETTMYYNAYTGEPLKYTN